MLTGSSLLDLAKKMASLEYDKNNVGAIAAAVFDDLLEQAHDQGACGKFLFAAGVEFGTRVQSRALYVDAADRRSDEIKKCVKKVRRDLHKKLKERKQKGAVV